MSRCTTIDGQDIRNATKPVTFNITKRDANLGAVKNPSACAAARACLHDVPECTEARVHISTTYLKIRDTWYRFRTPAALRTEIVGFDRGAQFTPGEYHLKPIQPSHRATGKRQGSNKKKTAPKRRSRPAPHQVTGVRDIAHYE